VKLIPVAENSLLLRRCREYFPVMLIVVVFVFCESTIIKKRRDYLDSLVGCASVIISCFIPFES